MSLPAADTTAKARILVADDHEASRMLAEAYLVAAGHTVTLVSSGPQAIDAFGKGDFDLVLLDIVMPGMDGIQTCQALRRMPRGPETPMIYLTGLAEREILERAASSGVDDLLWKPINRTELLVRVRALLRTKRLQDEQRANMRLIQEQHEALVRSQRLKDALSSFVVHDLKSPLASLAVSIDAASIDSKIEPETLECLAGARESVDTMSRLILNLLDISKSDESSLTPVLRDVSPCDILQDAIGSFRRRAQRKDIKLLIQRDEAGPRIRVDPDLIRRMLLNLVDNALRFSPSGRVVQICCSRKEDGILIRVSDEGPGVPLEYAEKIFDRFFQVEARSDEDAQSNRGLGLTFCRLVAEAHGGRIWVEPNTPRGAVFCVYLPAHAAHAAHEAHAALAARSPRPDPS